MVDLTEQERSGEFEHLLLTCIEGCGLQSKFKVRAAAAGMRTQLTYAQLYYRKMILFRFSEYVSFNTVNIKHTCYTIRPDQLNKLLHGFARSDFWANRRKKLIKLGGAYV